MFYLDDWVLAGPVEAVLGALQQASARLGLALNLDKSEAIAVGRTSPAALTAHLPASLLTAAGGSSRVLRNFEFLGAAIGRPAFLEAHAAGCVETADKLLESVAELQDPQVALRLLRASAGFARLVHTMRCCPPAGDSHALDKFDQLVQTCFSTFSGLHLEPGQWGQAARGLSHAGLALRSARQHAAGAYLSSVGGCADLCGDLDRGYWLDHSGDIAAALSELNAALPPNQLLGAAAALAQSQKQLSNLVDEAGWALQLDGASAVQKATLLSEAAPGARAFLTCVPSGRTKMEPAVFLSEVSVRLGVPEASQDAWCPKCDAVLDTNGHHSGMCLAGGERVLLNNALRDLVYSWAQRACLRP